MAFPTFIFIGGKAWFDPSQPKWESLWGGHLRSSISVLWNSVALCLNSEGGCSDCTQHTSRGWHSHRQQCLQSEQLYLQTLGIWLKQAIDCGRSCSYIIDMEQWDRELRVFLVVVWAHDKELAWSLLKKDLPAKGPSRGFLKLEDWGLNTGSESEQGEE